MNLKEMLLWPITGLHTVVAFLRTKKNGISLSPSVGMLEKVCLHRWWCCVFLRPRWQRSINWALLFPQFIVSSNKKCCLLHLVSLPKFPCFYFILPQLFHIPSDYLNSFLYHFPLLPISILFSWLFIDHWMDSSVTLIVLHVLFLWLTLLVLLLYIIKKTSSQSNTLCLAFYKLSAGTGSINTNKPLFKNS